MKINDFLSKNEQKQPKMKKNGRKSFKKEVIKMAIVISFLIVFGADILRIVIAMIGMLIHSIMSLLGSV